MEKQQVWAVRLGGHQREVKGTIELEDEALVFESSDGSPGERIALTDVRRAKRIRGSPVLVIHYVTGAEDARAAFYFSKPPPVDPPGVKKRKARRQAVHYLGMSNVDIKEDVKTWERAIHDAMKTAKETGSAG
ncbi:MAG: hypothetical protein ACJ76P_08170 [Actinomycetota bacterium]